MDFRLLGPLEVVTEDGAADVGAGKRAALLTYLLINANEVVSAERLIDELWDEHPPATAAKSVHVYVSQLRKALHANGGRLMTRGSGYVLELADGELDIQRFERALADAQHALEDDDADAAVTAARDALALWRGPALYDVAYESFAQNEAARLEELRLVALETRIEAELVLGKHARLVGELETLVAAHPTRERFRAQLMIALYRCGRHSEALDVYRDGARLLMDELGLEPSPELRELEQKILSHSEELGRERVWRPAARRRDRGGAAQDPATRARRGARLLLAGGAFLAVAATLAVLESTGGGGSAKPSGDTAASIDPATGRVLRSVTVGRTPTSIAAGSGSAWVLNADDQTISRIDKGSKRADTCGVGASPTGLAAGAGALWVAVGSVGRGEVGAPTDAVLRMDPARCVVSKRVPLPGGGIQGSQGLPKQIAVGAGAVWVVNGGGRLIKIDARLNRVSAAVPALRVHAIALAGGSVWAIPVEGTKLVEVDAASARVRRSVPIPAARLDSLAAGAGALWVVDSLEGALWRIDPGDAAATRKPIAQTIDVGAGADGVAVSDRAVWVINSLRGTVARVDPGTRRVTRTTSFGDTPRDITVGGGSVWVAVAGAGTLPVASTARATRHGALPRSACGRVFTAPNRVPDYLIASDFPLQSDRLDTQTMANAVEFVLRQHNFRAGRFLLGYQSCDAATPQSDQSDPKKCESNAKAYAATAAVIGIVGAYNSNCAFAELPILNRAPRGPLALVSPSASMTGLTKVDPTLPHGALKQLYPTGARNFARVFPANDAQTAADAILARRLGLRRVYLLNDDTPYGLSTAAQFRHSARAVELPLAGAAQWNRDDPTFTALARRVRGARADGVFLSGLLASNGGELVRALRASAGPRLTLIGPDGFGPLDAVYEFSHGAAKGLYSSALGLWDQHYGPVGQRFVSQFQPTQPGLNVTPYAVYAAAATQVLLDAIARSDGSRASVTRALFRTRLPRTVVGPVRFDQNGDLTSPPVTILRVVAGHGVSRTPYFTGSVVDRVIVPPAGALR
ncbi:MAG: BTAD domain-containing putative transcriptional regulator [Thermoleophilaceae bacterium]